jgi:hypothetical protein
MRWWRATGHVPQRGQVRGQGRGFGAPVVRLAVVSVPVGRDEHNGGELPEPVERGRGCVVLGNLGPGHPEVGGGQQRDDCLRAGREVADDALPGRHSEATQRRGERRDLPAQFVPGPGNGSNIDSLSYDGIPSASPRSPGVSIVSWLTGVR